MNPRLFVDRSVVACLAAALFVALVPLSGCEDGVESPEEVVRSYLDALRNDDNQKALETVWPETRTELVAGYEKLETYFEDDPPMEPAGLVVVTRVENPMVITRIEAEDEIPERPEDGERVSMNIELRDDRTAAIDVRWGADDNRWYVDLPVDRSRPLRVLPATRQGADEAVPEREGGSEP